MASGSCRQAHGSSLTQSLLRLGCHPCCSLSPRPSASRDAARPSLSRQSLFVPMTSARWAEPHPIVVWQSRITLRRVVGVLCHYHRPCILTSSWSASCTVDKSRSEHPRNYGLNGLSLAFCKHLRKLLHAVHLVRDKGGVRPTDALAWD